MTGWWLWQSVWKLKIIWSRAQGGRPMSKYEPPGLESPHQGVRAAGPVCCGVEKTHLAWPERGSPASASVQQPPGQKASRPLSSLQTSAVAGGPQGLFVRQTAAQQKLVPTAIRGKNTNLLAVHCMKNKQTPYVVWITFLYLYSYLSLNNVIHHIRIGW